MVKKTEKTIYEQKWKVQKCTVKKCWCSLIVLLSYDIKEDKLEDCVIPAGAISTKLAKYIVKLHNMKLMNKTLKNKKRNIKNNSIYNQKWKTEKCWTEKCWCKGIVLNGNSGDYIIRHGEVDKKLAEYIVKLHNEELKRLKDEK